MLNLSTDAKLPQCPRDRRGFSAHGYSLLGWFLVFLVSLDLATSPIHGHGHDGAWRPVVHALSAAPGTAGQVGAHYECDVPTDTAHSLIALRVRALQAAHPASGDNDVSLSPVSRIAGSVRLADLALRPDPRDAPTGIHRSLPPSCRAPPSRA